MPQFKVLQCETCGALTYKRLDHKTVRCPLCNAIMRGEPIKIFSSPREAVNFIKERKVHDALEQGELFESFR